MNRKLLSKALCEIDESFIAEAYRPVPEAASSSSERIVHMKKKRMITFALVAALMLSLSIAAYAAVSMVNSPQVAERVAKEEIERWKEIGLLNPEVAFEGEADRIVEFQEHKGDERWYGRFFAHSYDVRFYLGPVSWGNQTPSADLVQRKYGCSLTIDTLSGKITAATIDAKAGEDAVPVREDVWKDPVDPSDPEGEWVEKPIYFYDNYADIFPADMTVDRFCTLLAEYWGFSGYRLAETVNDFYYDEPQASVDPNSLLKDLNAVTRANYYLTVFFEGDQPGVPMYIQLNQFPGYVSLMVGTVHAVG